MGVIILGEITFETKVQASAAIQKILERNPPRRLLRGDDLRLVLELLKLHPDYSMRFAGQVRDIGVELAPLGGGSKRFYVVYTDGMDEPFAWRKCLEPPTRRQEVMQAFRHEVAEDVSNFARDYFQDFADEEGRVICPVTGRKITRHGAHVDHEWPRTFDVMVEKFLSKRGIDIEAIETISLPGAMGGREIKDRQLAADFATFHRKWARLRVIEAGENIKRGNRK